MKVPELRHRILFTLAMIVVVRLGVQIPLPGIDVMELQKVIEASANASGPGAGLATVLTIFSGGGLQQCGIFAPAGIFRLRGDKIVRFELFQGASGRAEGTSDLCDGGLPWAG